MSLTDPPLEITLEFTGKDRTFSWEPKEYVVTPTLGEGSSVSFPWPEVKRSIEALSLEKPGSAVFERFGQRLRGLLAQAEWALDENAIRHALETGRPVHLTLRSKRADEIFYLPWEALPLKGGSWLGGMENCLIQYESGSRSSRKVAVQPAGRILVAWSAAGGWVPAEKHIEAISAACRDSGLRFDPDEDIVGKASRNRLAEKLEESERPVTALHLLCHGEEVDGIEGGAYGLVLDPADPEDSDPDVLDASMLQALLFSGSRSSALRLVTICACQGGDAGTPANPVGSVARMFHRQGVPAVIASRLPLSCSGSITLTQVLYQGLLVKSDNLRTVLSSARKKLLRKERSSDWISLQFYARNGDEAALFPFSAPPPRTATTAPIRELVLIRHEAYSTAHGAPTPEDAPGLFANRHVRPLVSIGQAFVLSERRWENLEPEVARLAAKDGVLRRLFDEQDTDIIYFGFPYVSFAVLAGYLAKTRPVHVLEHDRSSGRFTWQHGTQEAAPQLKIEAAPRETGSAVRVRLSISADVRARECEEVLPDSEVGLDLHFMLEQPKRGIVRREAQLLEYAQAIREALDKHIAGNSAFRSLHVFAAVPVSIAFHLGRALAFTGLPECFVYNYDGRDSPRYKWRLSLQAAAEGRPAVTVFPS